MSEYRYAHFQARRLVEDLAFTGGVRPGDAFPDFDLPTLVGGRLSNADLTGRPTLMYFASVT